jgi:hypothetical protein
MEATLFTPIRKSGFGAVERINMIEEEFWQIRVEKDVILPYNNYSVQAADRAACNPASTCSNLL